MGAIDVAFFAAQPARAIVKKPLPGRRFGKMFFMSGVLQLRDIRRIGMRNSADASKEQEGRKKHPSPQGPLPKWKRRGVRDAGESFRKKRRLARELRMLGQHLGQMLKHVGGAGLGRRKERDIFRLEQADHHRPMGIGGSEQ